MNSNLPEKNNFYLYFHSSVPWQQKILSDFLNSIPIEKKFRCLDAGCGIGNNFPTLLRFFSEITACDISRKSLEYVENQFKNFKINFVQANIESLPFKDNSFDVVICTEVLEHVENLQKVTNELIRVLKKDKGYFIISTPNYFNLAGIVKLIMDRILKKETWDVWGDAQRIGEIERFMTWFTLKKLFSRQSIKIIQERGGDFLNSWFLFLPFVYRNFKLTDKYPFLWFGKLPLFRKIGMNYFILGTTTISR